MLAILVYHVLIYSMDEKVIGIFRDISQIIVATVVEFDEEKIIVKNPAMLGISAQGQNVTIQFIPIEVLSLQPVVQIRNIMANPTEELLYTFYRRDMIKDEIELSDQVVENYKKSFNPSSIITPDKSIVKPDEKIVKLF